MVQPENRNRSSLLSVLLLALSILSSLGHAGEVPDTIKRALAARDYETAVAWLNDHAAEPEAAFELGKLYRLGKGVPKDGDRAVDLFLVAGEAGHVEAQYLLAKHYDRLGDSVTAGLWMRQAAAAGHSRAGAWLEQTVETEPALDLAGQLRRGLHPPSSPDRRALSVTDDAGRTLLVLAARQGNGEWIDFLIGAGLPLDTADRFGVTALHAALAVGQTGIAGRLLAAGANPNVATDDGTTPLHQAVAAGEIDMIRALLKAGADPGRENAAGWSADMLARRDDDVVLRGLFGHTARDRDPLVGLSADLSSREEIEKLFADAVRRGDAELMDRILEKVGKAETVSLADGPLLLIAVQGGDPQVVQRLLAAGADPDSADAKGRSALLTALAGDCSKCVALLITAGADVNQTGANGRTPLMAAARIGDEADSELLITAGADLDRIDALGRTAFWWASREHHTALALRLLDLGAAPLADQEAVSPLHLAAENDDVELVSRLLDLANIDRQSAAGNTPLLLAAHIGAAAATQTLIEAGAAIELINNLGDTALIAAVRAGHLNTAELLLRAGANPNTRNQQFESAAQLIDSRQSPEWKALAELADKGLFGLFGSLTD